jgi:hypothetical protein
MARFLAYFAAAFVAFIGATWLWVICQPGSYLDKMYAQWEAKLDLLQDMPPGSVVILGSSLAEHDLDPARLGPDVYNLALGGATSIEVSHLARKLVASPHPPRAIILSISPYRCFNSFFFWDTGVKYGLFDANELETIRADARRFDGPHRVQPDAVSPFGPATLGDVEARLKDTLYVDRFPSYYLASLLAGGLFLRHHDNVAMYNETRAHRGFDNFIDSNGSQELTPDVDCASFVHTELLDHYLSLTIEVFQKKNIPVYFIGCPINESTFKVLHPGYATGYADFLKSYEARYSNFRLLGDPMPSYPWTDFQDGSHLDEKSADKFSNQVAVLLKKAGVEN